MGNLTTKDGFFKKLTPCILIVFFTFTFSSIQAANTPLPAEVKKVLNKHKLPQSSLSLYIKEVDKVTPLISNEINTPRNPASVIKLVTTYAALEILGPNHTWQTNFYALGNIDKETLNGDLLMLGSGDPFLVQEKFLHILNGIQSRGVRHINGDFVIDNSIFAKEFGTTADFDNEPLRAYNVFPDAALLNFNTMNLIFYPEKDRLKIFTEPANNNLEIRNLVQLSNSSCRGFLKKLRMKVTTENDKTVLTVSGQYPKACGERQLLRSLINKPNYSFGMFKSLWGSLGGTVKGNGFYTAFDKKSLSNIDPIYVHLSEPLNRMIEYINKYSNNVMTRQLFLQIGFEKNNPATKQDSRLMIADWLKQKGIQAPELFIDNGAGLSRDTRISAITLARMLEKALKSPYAPEYLSSIAIAGVDGTMRKRVKELPKGSMRIKTGLLKNVRSMAGYVNSQSGKQYVIVSLQNHPGVQNWVGTEVQDAVLRWLYKQ